MYYIWEFGKCFNRNRPNSLCFYSPTMNKYTIQKYDRNKVINNAA